MDKTPFAGLTHLKPGEALSTDGFSFQDVNPAIIDRLLQIGAVGHRHDGHGRVLDPADEPTISVLAGGGQIPADTTIWACYTALDITGGETLPSPAQAITTPPAMDAPDGPATVVIDTTAGALLVNTYLYAVTLLDGTGGETTVGPSAAVTRPPGPANARALVSGLTAICAASGATGWRLWRSVGGGRWGYLGTGDAATDTFTDDGSSSPDCTLNPPTRNTTNSLNGVRVVVPNTLAAGSVFFRIYLSEDGSFGSPSLVGTHPIADAASNIDFAILDPADGAPPAVSQSIGGAAQINADTDIFGMHWRTPVATASALGVGARGDVCRVLDEGIDYTVFKATGAAVSADWSPVLPTLVGPALPTNPPTRYLWVQTGLGDGTDFEVWVETGA